MNAIDDFLKKKQVDDKPISYWIDLIESMLNSGDFDWADNTLEGIYEHISEYETITEKQIMAINNIWQGQKNNQYGNRRNKKRYR